jgi:hypothetical protein
MWTQSRPTIPNAVAPPRTNAVAVVQTLNVLPPTARAKVRLIGFPRVRVRSAVTLIALASESMTTCPCGPGSALPTGV